MALQLALIIPGPKLRDKIDKTAEACFKQPALKEKLIQRDTDRGETEFQFLLPNNEHHPYFLQQLQKARDAASRGATAVAPASATTASATNANAASKEDAAAAANSAAAAAAAARHEQFTRDPHPEEFSIPLIAKGLPALEMELIQLAAQHAAVHGDAFVRTLQAKNQQRRYEFLSEDHPRHQIFARLRNAYRLVLCTVAANVAPQEAAAANPSSAYAARDFQSRFELLAGETSDDVLGDPARAREAFLEECRRKRAYMLQQDEERKQMLSLADEARMLNFSDFVVQKTLTLEMLKLA